MRLRLRSRAPLFLLVGTAVICWTVEAAGIRLNLTPSMPIGLYRLSDAPVELGDLVAACLPERAGALGRDRGYLRPGPCPADAAPVIKRVAAIAGDLVEATSQGIFVAGKRVQDPPSTVDSQGRAVESLPPGDYLLSSGQLWLYSPRENSWDSRYFGPVSLESVLGTVTPIWTCGVKFRSSGQLDDSS